VFEIPEWPYFLGAPHAGGVIRSRPEDFFVEEITRVHPDGDGSHMWLWIEKRDANTDWVAAELAKATGCAHRDVGYAGLKDRHAVTRQWFSLPATETIPESIKNAKIEGVSILDCRLHGRKLKRGTLEGNRFRLTIRQFKGDITQTGQRLEQIRAMGVPNYFGPQRFGHGGRNVERGFNLLSKRARLSRNKKSIYLSAIRSFLFNQVLAERVRRGLWNTMLDGELAMLNGTRSIFPCEKTDIEIEDRCKRLDIHPTGPMPGENGSQPGTDAADIEQAVLQNWTQLTGVLQSQRVQASRRALRLYPAEFEWCLEDSVLTLGFVLPPGTYATTVLREILVFTDAQGIANQD
jgi:tRNA pseudouridine13 synthase